MKQLSRLRPNKGLSQTHLFQACLVLAACSQPADSWPAHSLDLATFEKNGVRVSLGLEPAISGQALLTATFTPLQAGFHVYSKDLPRDGVSSIGRPTLLELLPDSKMQKSGELRESVPASQEMTGSTPELSIYPPGTVTLSLQVTLPKGQARRVDDQVSITYMACSSNGCLPPVIGQVIPVQVPTLSPAAPGTPHSAFQPPLWQAGPFNYSPGVAAVSCVQTARSQPVRADGPGWKALRRR